MSDKERANGCLFYQNKVYQEVTHIDDTEIVEQFMEKQGQNPEDALAYLSQWDYGDRCAECLPYEQITEGLRFVNYAVNDVYLAIWQTGIDSVSLYRVTIGENRDCEEKSDVFI